MKKSLHDRQTTNDKQRLIPLGVITGAHGVRGQVKLRSFTADPHDITAYGPLRDASGKSYAVTVTGGTKDALIASVDGVTTREGADALRNTELLVPREALPKAGAHEYYHEDLMGLRVTTGDGADYGSITGVHNFGAGDLLEVTRADGTEELLPFTRKTFPRVDPEQGIAVIAPPEPLGDE